MIGGWRYRGNWHLTRRRDGDGEAGRAEVRVVIITGSITSGPTDDKLKIRTHLQKKYYQNNKNII